MVEIVSHFQAPVAVGSSLISISSEGQLEAADSADPPESDSTEYEDLGELVSSSWP